MCEKIKDQDDSIKYEYIYIYILKAQPKIYVRI